MAATPDRRAGYGQVRPILAQADRRWVSATGRRSAIEGRLPVHSRLIINRVEMATSVQALHRSRFRTGPRQAEEDWNDHDIKL